MTSAALQARRLTPQHRQPLFLRFWTLWISVVGSSAGVLFLRFSPMRRVREEQLA